MIDTLHLPMYFFIMVDWVLEASDSKHWISVTVY